MIISQKINRLFGSDSLTVSDEAITHYGSKEAALAACERLEAVFPSLKTPGSIIQAELEADSHLTELERVCSTIHLNPLLEPEVITYQKSKVQRTVDERIEISFRESFRKLKQFFMHGAVGKFFAFAMWLIGYPAAYTVFVGLEQVADGRWDTTPWIYLMLGIPFALVVLSAMFESCTEATSQTNKSSKPAHTVSDEELRKKANALGKQMKQRGEWVPTQRGLEILVLRDLGQPQRPNQEITDSEDKSFEGFRSVVRWTLTAPLALPIMFALYLPIAFIGAFFVPKDSSRRWRKMSVEQFLAGKELSFDIVAALDRVIAWFPGEQVEVIALCNRGEKTSQEAFLAINVRGQDHKKLYLEHILH
jgi:hypothetical protein